MFDRWTLKSALGRKMDGIREQRKIDPRTGKPYPEKTEAERQEEFSKLSECHQADGGPCHLPVVRPPDDKRCSVSVRMRVSCPYLGKATPLKEKVRDEAEERQKDELIQEPPPEFPV